MTINAAWHKRHRMPKNPTVEQRIVWHKAHQSHCACRAIPSTLLPSIRRVSVDFPAPKRAGPRVAAKKRRVRR
jgi:hypothetical protein